MKKYPGDARRRRDLADAASGFGRTAVVLYACIPAERGEDAVLPDLRRFALARDWVITQEVVDRGPVTMRLDARDRWPCVQDLINSDRASGIVTLTRSMCGYYPDEREHVAAWLAARNAFIAAALPADVGIPEGAR